MKSKRDTILKYQLTWKRLNRRNPETIKLYRLSWWEPWAVWGFIAVICGLWLSWIYRIFS